MLGNSAVPDQIAPIRVYTVCHSACIVSTHYSMVEPHSSNFRVFRKFTVLNSKLGTYVKLSPPDIPGLVGAVVTKDWCITIFSSRKGDKVTDHVT